jgi:chaperone LolA
MVMINYFISISLISIILISSFVSAQTDPNILLKNIQSRLDGIKDLSMDFKQSVNEKSALNGKVFFKKEEKVRFEMENTLIISDGETSWNYNKKKNEVVIVTNNESANYLSINKIVYEYPAKCSLSSEIKDGSDVLVLTPVDSELNFNSVKLFINSDNLVFKAVVDDPAGGLIQLDFSNHKTNNNLTDSYFTFSPPEGSKIIDLR